MRSTLKHGIGQGQLCFWREAARGKIRLSLRGPNHHLRPLRMTGCLKQSLLSNEFFLVFIPTRHNSVSVPEQRNRSMERCSSSR